MNLLDRSRMRAPAIIPHGWSVLRTPEGTGIFRDSISGLRMIFSRDNLSDEAAAYAGPGWYAHLSLSRQDRYPGWDEMEDALIDTGFFDRKRGIHMVLPPADEYTNVHPNCFHWWQVIR